MTTHSSSTTIIKNPNRTSKILDYENTHETDRNAKHTNTTIIILKPPPPPTQLPPTQPP
ncbi:hypothetical protein OAO87_01130 [bacterium]|nr:hypothetical protein [bacterium]